MPTAPPPPHTTRDVERFVDEMERTLGTSQFNRLFSAIRDYRRGTITIEESVNRVAEILLPHPELLERNHRFIPNKLLRTIGERRGTLA
jgi:hypothetical protein